MGLLMVGAAPRLAADCDDCPNRRPGDVNGDGAANDLDIPSFIDVLFDPVGATPDELCAADVNSDSAVDGLDVAALVPRMLGTP